MAMKYTDVFHCKSLQNLPKLGFLVRKYMCHLATLPLKANDWRRRFCAQVNRDFCLTSSIAFPR
jgi:hypothetical protein